MRDGGNYDDLRFINTLIDLQSSFVASGTDWSASTFPIVVN